MGHGRRQHSQKKGNPMTELPFKTEIPIAFDPATATDKVQEVFADPIARSLWLAIKIGHLVNQYFDDDCIAIAGWIHKQRDEGELERSEFIRRTASNMCNQLIGVQILGRQEIEFGTALITYLLDGGVIEYLLPSATLR